MFRTYNLLECVDRGVMTEFVSHGCQKSLIWVNNIFPNIVEHKTSSSISAFGGPGFEALLPHQGGLLISKAPYLQKSKMLRNFSIVTHATSNFYYQQ